MRNGGDESRFRNAAWVDLNGVLLFGDFLFHFVVLQAGDTQESPSILRHTDSSYKPVLVFHHLPNFVGFWWRCFFNCVFVGSYHVGSPAKKTDGSTTRNPIAVADYIYIYTGEESYKQLCSRNNWPSRDTTTLFSLSIWLGTIFFFRGFGFELDRGLMNTLFFRRRH